MIVEHFVDGEKRIAEVCDGLWMLEKPMQVIEGNFLMMAYRLLGGSRSHVNKLVLMNDESKRFERFLLFSSEPFVVVTGISQKSIDHITFNAVYPGVVKGDEVIDVADPNFVTTKVEVDGISGEFTTLALAVRLAILRLNPFSSTTVS